MYFDYLQEREGFNHLKTDQGFITYRIDKDECFIQDVYVVPDSRKDGFASLMCEEVDQMAKIKGCKILTTQSDIHAKNPEPGVMAIIKYGFKILDIKDNHLIRFYKEIS